MIILGKKSRHKYRSKRDINEVIENSKKNYVKPKKSYDSKKLLPLVLGALVVGSANADGFKAKMNAGGDFFKDKITDAMLLGDIRTAISKDTDVILFNIDSRANTDDKEDAILKVFLKVFNERLGYCGDHPHIAHMERELDNREQYQAFQDAFAKLTDSTWRSERDAFDFYRDEMGQALSTATGQTEDSTRQWVENLETNFALDIQNFCEWVKAYLDKSSGNDGKHLLFLVDEVGQFIGQNTQMMLKLQTITETLGTVCACRAWVIVT